MKPFEDFTSGDSIEIYHKNELLFTGIYLFTGNCNIEKFLNNYLGRTLNDNLINICEISCFIGKAEGCKNYDIYVITKYNFRGRLQFEKTTHFISESSYWTNNNRDDKYFIKSLELSELKVINKPILITEF